CTERLLQLSRDRKSVGCLPGQAVIQATPMGSFKIEKFPLQSKTIRRSMAQDLGWMFFIPS
ncbi:MAG: hypothetical protein KC964_03090, partial [Candidatus Omnitrophica bacterium]|nr:hypothetical protein [Candidatus Omnitrophota bacterium]